MNADGNWLIWVALFILAMYIGRFLTLVNRPRTSSDYRNGNLVIQYKNKRIVIDADLRPTPVTYFNDGDKEYITIGKIDSENDVKKGIQSLKNTSEVVQLLFNFRCDDHTFVRFDPVNAQGLIEAQLKLWNLVNTQT
ncbi:hypothetical protein D5W64_12200 [Salmonella enterica subsp. enterica serovar Saintpaul]|nr:hypothetical protein [Salmonella enterica subsp. enterica serovar Saintpaul]